MRRAYRSGGHAECWPLWLKHLAKRKKPGGLDRLLPDKRWPLGWALPDAFTGSAASDDLDCIERICCGRRPDQPAADTVIEWLADAAGGRVDAVYAVETLAWCHALPRLANMVPAEVWWNLLDHLFQAVAEADQVTLGDDPLVHQLLAGELPWTLAWLFPEIAPARKLAKPARAALSAGPGELCDGEGMLEAAHIECLRPLLACWTRCMAIGEAIDKRPFNNVAQNQYEWFVRAALRLARYDGSQAFSTGPAGGWCRGLFEAALRFGGDGDDHDIAGLVLPRKGKKDGGGSQTHLPDPSLHSQWAATAVLRPDWSRSGPRLTVLFPGRQVSLELESQGELIWSGCWGLDVRRDGRQLQPKSDWEEVCWASDDDADFIELRIDLEDDLCVERHIAFAREDRLLMLADAVLGQQPAELEYRGSLPLSDGITLAGADETREEFLVGRRRRALALPLALPEWRADRRVGSLEEVAGRLELRQSSAGRALYAPLLFDLDQKRLARSSTWRQLTVAESLQTQPADRAVGYRVQIGREQWLIYRSLAEKANRTLLGHNLSTEMLFARFDECGEIEPLVEIE